MKTELFGVFGDREQFMRFRSPNQFDQTVEGESITLGVRDPHLGLSGRTAIHRAADGFCVIWGEAFPMAETRTPTAEWLYERYVEDGRDAVEQLNGSYVVVIEQAGDAVVITDPIHSWECFYTDSDGVRRFSTDAGALTRTLPSVTSDCRGLCEFIHFGLTFGETTAVSEINRLPFDSSLTADSIEPLSRFVYQPSTFDYAEELADRLERAIKRRASYPGTNGMLMSAGFDSRLLLATLPAVDICYTLGRPQSPEVRVARKVASQYDTRHQTLDRKSVV